MFPSSHIPRRQLAGHDGFVFVELLVSLIAAMMVAALAFSMVQVSMGQAARVTEHANAERQGRAALEQVMSVLDNSCVAPRVQPVSAGSDATRLVIVSEAGGGAALQSVRLHEITLVNGTLTDTSYADTGSKPAPEWEFSKTGTTTTLASGVTAVGSTPVFQYFASASASSPLATPLSSATAAETTSVTVTFTMAAGGAGANAGSAHVLSDTALLRLAASAPGENAPCA